MPLYFPHDSIRPSQKELIEMIEEGLRKGKPTLVHAPTGLGKTAATLSAAVSYLFESNKAKTIFFITPKHTQHRIAIETLRMMKEKHNIPLIVVDLIGKKHMCAQPGVQEFKGGEFYDYCRELVEQGGCEFYNRIKQKSKISVETEAVLSQLSEKILHVEELKEISIKNHLCPFEVACLLGQKAKVVIADYHHILNPTIRNNLFKKVSTSLEESIIIIDEGHNLAEHCRNLLSTQTSTVILEAAKKEALQQKWPELAEEIEALHEQLEAKASTMQQFVQEIKVEKEEITKKLQRDAESICEDLEVIAEEIRETKKRSACHIVAEFLRSWEGQDQSFIRILRKNRTLRGKPNNILSYKCLDPSLILKPIAEQAANLIIVSGTLNPISMYKEIFGIDAQTAEIKNPFPAKNKLSIIIPETSTKYTVRDESMFQRIGAICSEATKHIPGNLAIFFPSYDLRDKVAPYIQRATIKTLFFEQPKMTKQDKQLLIEKFKQYQTAGAILLGAAAGNFGEGLDMKGNVLKAVIVVGLPLAKPDLETQELIKYYDEKFGKGWEYGYTMPAMVKCFQNAGRCIRSEKDRAIIIYLDERFAWENYMKYFPKEEERIVSKEPWIQIQEFFKTTPEHL